MSFLALVYYLGASWTNPGYLIGSAVDVAKKSGAYDPKMYAVDGGDNNLTVDLSAVCQNGNDHSGEGDLSIIDRNLDDISPTGASRHNKNPSFLTKDFNISRHERQKSAMCADGDPQAVLDSQPNQKEIFTAGNNAGAKVQPPFSQFSSNESGILKGNLSVNDKQHRRRIKSVLPGDYNSNFSSESRSHFEEHRADADVLEAHRGGAGGRKAAYEAI